MPITMIQDLEADAAFPQFSELHSLICWRARNLESDAAIAVVVPTGALSYRLGVDSAMLIISLPDDGEAFLPELAVAELDVCNTVRAGLQTCTSMLMLQSHQLAVEMNVRSLKPDFPRIGNCGWSYLGVAAGNRLVIVQHCMGQEWLESHHAFAQGPSERFTTKPMRSRRAGRRIAAARG